MCNVLIIHDVKDRIHNTNMEVSVDHTTHDPEHNAAGWDARLHLLRRVSEANLPKKMGRGGCA